ncbi:hypothetical protein [Butyrivibrio sp. INlla14]|uniref:hypothetical protein n=1 Tax=Butyrivibrio sp. INlla14 TaxID=1520808 RepID=UPI0008768281|nr:hypothetical protein [Butyrivibrio sp. INlla14]SCY67918.1 hypothetical protein SAMN02910371_03353 [Butyrivibrio sp. INlla14]
MKKFKLLIISILSVVLIFSTVYTNNLKAYASYDEFIPFCFDNTVPNYDNIRSAIYPQVFSITPIEIWDLFIQEGVKIYVTSSAPRFNTNGGAINGKTYGASVIFNPSSKKIQSVNAPVEIYISNNANVDTYLHECGHALDFIAEYITGYYKGNCTISASSKWKSLYSKYASVMARFDIPAANNMYDATEGFAEAYRLYLTYPQDLKTYCPEVFTFVANQITKPELFTA